MIGSLHAYLSPNLLAIMWVSIFPTAFKTNHNCEKCYRPSCSKEVLKIQFLMLKFVTDMINFNK